MIDITKPLSEEEKTKMYELILRTLTEYDSDEVTINLSNDNVVFDVIISMQNFKEKKENEI